MNEEKIQNDYIEMLILDLEEHSFDYWESTQDEMVEALRNLQQERDKYKSIVDKAIKYIEETQLNGNKISEMLCGSEIVKLLEILKELEEGNSNINKDN